jgi:AcrR family transcriptional regulator
MPPEKPLPQRILDAAEKLLRRHGVKKMNVVDIAEALEMSHGNIYRHFTSKQAILEGVVMRWLQVVIGPLETIAHDRTRPAPERLAAWFDSIRAAKRRKIRDDAELFRVHYDIVEAAREIVGEHVAELQSQVEQIIADGVKAGEFSRKLNVRASARAFLQATSPFHNPAMLMQKPMPTEAEARVVLGLLLAGLRAGIEET